jgi:hypothetical protein
MLMPGGKEPRPLVTVQVWVPLPPDVVNGACCSPMVQVPKLDPVVIVTPQAGAAIAIRLKRQIPKTELLRLSVRMLASDGVQRKKVTYTAKISLRREIVFGISLVTVEEDVDVGRHGTITRLAERGASLTHLTESSPGEELLWLSVGSTPSIIA